MNKEASAEQRQKTVSAYFTSKQILPFDFAQHCICLMIHSIRSSRKILALVEIKSNLTLILKGLICHLIKLQIRSFNSHAKGCIYHFCMFRKGGIWPFKSQWNSMANTMFYGGDKCAIDLAHLTYAHLVFVLFHGYSRWLYQSQPWTLLNTRLFRVCLNIINDFCNHLE